jgi:hypothetical protein
MSAYFVDVPALEDVITKGVEATFAWAEGFVGWVEEWEVKFAFASREKSPRWELV